jgi:hypothetical protein
MRLSVHGAEARRKMFQVDDSRCQRGLQNYWYVRQDGTVQAHSLLWLFCWAETGMRNAAAMYDCRRLWDEFTGIPFPDLDTSAFHAFARRHRYTSSLHDDLLIREMEATCHRDLTFLVDGSTTPFPDAPVHGALPPPPMPRTESMPAAVPSAPPSPGHLASADLERIHSLCRGTDDRLWKAFRTSRASGSSAEAGLAFPSYAGRPGMRVSEQEAWDALCLEIEAGKYFRYSLETPTSSKYAWGQAEAEAAEGTGMSGRLDVTMCAPDGRPVVNVELKAGGSGASLGASAMKDMIKLVNEPGDGLWFGLLESATEESLRQALIPLWTAIAKAAAMNEVSVGRLPMTMIFHVCVLDPGFSIHRVVELEGPTFDGPLTAERFANCRIVRQRVRGSVREISETGGWTARFSPDA